jgi:hypothetical protein
MKQNRKMATCNRSDIIITWILTDYICPKRSGHWSVYGGEQTNPYMVLLLDDCSLAPHEPMYGLFCPSLCLHGLYIPMVN